MAYKEEEDLEPRKGSKEVKLEIENITESPTRKNTVKLAALAEMHNPFDKKQADLALFAMEKTII